MAQALLEKIRERIERHYIITERIPAIRARLEERFGAGAYAGLAGQALAEALTVDLREVSEDRHFKVTYSKDPVLSGEPGEETPEEIAEFRRVARWHNHGCERIERLAGNVGFWRISEFYDLEDGSEPTFVAAMRLLQYSDALIVDVRGNSGGDPATVALACSFFFDVEPVHLNTLVSGQGNARQEWWTRSDLDCERYLDRPAFVLTDATTYSAAEEFAYDLQCLERARVVGSRTGGAAHLRESYPLDDHFRVNVPMARPVNPYTGQDWESVGVQPDVEVEPASALHAAHRLALEYLSQKSPVGEVANEIAAALSALEARSA